MLTIYACAAIGGTIAAIADLVQKEKASAVLKMTTVSARHLDLAVPPLYIFLVVVSSWVCCCVSSFNPAIDGPASRSAPGSSPPS